MECGGSAFLRVSDRFRLNLDVAATREVVKVAREHVQLKLCIGEPERLKREAVSHA